MTNSDLRNFISSNYGVDFDELTVDAENVLRRCYEAQETPALDLFRGIDGQVYVRFAA